MTGFAYVSFNFNHINYTLEIKSLNNRFLDIKINLPETLSNLEMTIHQAVKGYFSRGNIQVTLKEVMHLTQSESVTFDTALIERYLKEIDALKQNYDLKGELSLDSIVQLPNVIAFNERKTSKELESILLSHIVEVCELVVESRKKEGEHLKADLLARSKSLSELLSQIDLRLPLIEKAYKKRISERVLEITNDELIEAHIKQEIALLVEKNDVTEEVTRLRSHLGLFAETIELDRAVGRKLEFIVQEIHREINTVGSKANDALLSEYVIDFKGELEKIREQIQNIE